MAKQIRITFEKGGTFLADLLEDKAPVTCKVIWDALEQPVTEKFIHSNPGLESRFNRFLHFDDYSSDELMEIFRMQCKKDCYTLEDQAAEMVRDFIKEENTDGVSFGNARGVRNIFEQILVHQANRLAGMDSVTKEDLMTITPRDVLMARGMEEGAEMPPYGDPKERDKQ